MEKAALNLNTKLALNMDVFLKYKGAASTLNMKLTLKLGAFLKPKGGGDQYAVVSKDFGNGDYLISPIKSGNKHHKRLNKEEIEKYYIVVESKASRILYTGSK